VGYANYRDIWKIVPLARYLKNSLIISLATMVVAVILSGFAGYALSRFTFRGRRLFEGSVLLTQSFLAFSFYFHTICSLSIWNG